MIVHGVSEGLAGFLMKGRTPAGALFVTLAAEDVDVNVHPTKQEVRFHRPHRVRQLVVQAVRHAIETYQDEIKFSLFGAPRALFRADIRDGFDVFPDGESFVLNRLAPPPEAGPLTLIQNWEPEGR